jgi:hypothetical protein
MSALSKEAVRGVETVAASVMESVSTSESSVL